MTRNWRHSSSACEGTPAGTDLPVARLAWRPSRWLVVAQPVLGLLGAVSLAGSAAPAPWAWAGGCAAVAWGLASARRLAGRPSAVLAWPVDGRPTLDGVPLRDARLIWRGPLVFLRWRGPDGRWCHLSWWPDTLPAGARRSLRIAASAPGSPARARSMAG